MIISQDKFIKYLTESIYRTLNEITSEDVTEEANNVNTSPTDPQIEAGNYKKGHIRIEGMPITIENPKGSHRRGTDRNGKSWDIRMKNHYGYFGLTDGKGKDGDAVDVFLGPKLDNIERVYVIDQKVGGKFDESKVMLGFDSKEKARDAYLSNYTKGWNGLWKITGVSLDVFKQWLYRGRKQRQPFAQYVAIKKNKLEEQRLLKEEEYNELRPIARVLNKYEANDIVNLIRKQGIEAYTNNGIVFICVEQDRMDPYYVDDMVKYCKKIAQEFHNEHMPATMGVNEEIGLKDMYFNVIDNPEKERASEPPYDNWKRVRRGDHKMNLKNTDTDEYLCDEWYDWIGYLVKGLAIVENDGLYNLVNDEGQIVLPEWHEDINDKHNDGESYVLIDGDDATVVTRNDLLLK